MLKKDFSVLCLPSLGSFFSRENMQIITLFSGVGRDTYSYNSTMLFRVYSLEEFYGIDGKL